MNPRSRRLVVLGASLAFAACYAPIRVHPVRPSPPPAVVVRQASLESAARKSTVDPRNAAMETLESLKRAHDRVAAGDSSAIPEYNYLVARFLDRIQGAGIKPRHDKVRVEGSRSTCLIDWKEPPDLDTTDRRFIASDAVGFSGRYARTRAVRDGVGAPLLALSDSTYSHFDEKFHYRNLTALVTFPGRKVSVRLIDPHQHDHVRIGDRTYPLHSDFGLNVSYALTETRIDKLGLRRMLNPGRFSETARLSRLQPYDPERIPVLMVHGLQDTPASFLPMYTALMADPRIRERYQFWVFSYPSGYPYPYSASLLRKELDRMKTACPGHKDIIMIGHSMGGLLTHLMLTDAGDRIWRSYFGTSPAETQISGGSRAALEASLIFHSREDIGRAIFIATPHRGSNLATNWIGRTGSRLVRAPAFIADARDSIANVMTADPAAKVLDRAPNSIDTLSPRNRFLLEVNRIPLTRRIPYHSIMGDRGKGNTPDSSDGVVAYWSSHWDGAVSEKIVPSDHSAHQHPDAIGEVHRILLAHDPL